MAENAQVIGRARTVLVSGRGEDQKAVISAIVVRRIEEEVPGKRLFFRGTVKFSASTKRHIKDTILPIIDRIMAQLGRPKISFEISAVNLGAASALDVGVDISGYSADLPVFIALLSAALQLPLSNDFVTTGHIASVDGDISDVKGIAVKVQAARDEPTIKRFIYPDLEKDKSLGVLSPDQMVQSVDGVMGAWDRPRVRAVSGIGELVNEVFAEEAIVLAALKEGFFSVSKTAGQSSNPLQDVVCFLTDNNQRRFWDILEHHLLEIRCERGKELLEAYAQFFVGQRAYPAGFGARLFQLACSLPPGVKAKLKKHVPLLGKDFCFKLHKLTLKENSCADLLVLLDAVHVRNIPTKSLIGAAPAQETKGYSTTFDALVAEINEQALARQVGNSIDSVRGSYVMASSTVESYEEFLDSVQAYYMHMRCHISSDPTTLPDITEACSEAIALLQRAFYDKGGDRGAYVRARDGTEGGLPGILNIITERFKAEKQEAYVQMVFRDTIEALDWDERVKCMQAMMQQVGRFLPEELKDQPAERFARDYEALVRAYVNNSDKINRLLLSM